MSDEDVPPMSEMVGTATGEDRGPMESRTGSALTRMRVVTGPVYRSVAAGANFGPVVALLPSATSAYFAVKN